MPTPFLALSPQQPRIIDLYYEANVGFCADVTDSTDSTDSSDVSDGDMEI
jgi:hypothetical protein